MKAKSLSLVIIWSMIFSISTIAQVTVTCFITIPVETVVDKIRGGMLGQILGNLNGLKYEIANKFMGVMYALDDRL